MLPRSGGREVSRIEGFSDAVFGFSLTLLVASIEVPPDFEVLKQTLRGFLPFALTFALISWIWYLHYSFFRQFGLEDRLTIVLNSVLMFVVLFFVYPLKVMANALVGMGEARFDTLSEYDNRFLMVSYGAGVIAVFLVFFLLNWNAYRQRRELDLTATDLYDIGTALRAHASSTLRGQGLPERRGGRPFAGCGVGDHGNHPAAKPVLAVGNDLRPGGSTPGRQWLA